MPKASNKRPSLRELLTAHQKRTATRGRLEQRDKSAGGPVSPSNSFKRQATGYNSKLDQSARVKATSNVKRKVIVPYSKYDRTLMIGEGNFSFALALITGEATKATPARLCATSYDTQDECYKKYPEAEGNVSVLRSSGAIVLFGIDATKLDKHKEIRGKVFDRVSFNFPHVGSGIKDQDRNILANQQLIIGFLQSCATLLAQGEVPSIHKKRKRPNDDDENEDGKVSSGNDPSDDERTLEPTGGNRSIRGSVLITLRDYPPYTLWDVPRLAKKPPLPPYQLSTSRPVRRYIVLRSFLFDPCDYEGYEHRRTIGGATGLAPNEDLKRTEGTCRTWEFVLRDEPS